MNNNFKKQLSCYKIVNKGKTIEFLDYYYGWNKIENITDLWQFIGWLINEFDSIISFHYLEYYNPILNDFNFWLLKVKENNNLVARFKCDKNEFVIKIEIVGE